MTTGIVEDSPPSDRARIAYKPTSFTSSRRLPTDRDTTGLKKQLQSQRWYFLCLFRPVAGNPAINRVLNQLGSVGDSTLLSLILHGGPDFLFTQAEDLTSIVISHLKRADCVGHTIGKQASPLSIGVLA